MSNGFRWLTIEGHRMNFIETAERAEAIASQFIDDGFSVQLDAAPDPTTLPHGDPGHACHDSDGACIAAAGILGWSSYYNDLSCVQRSIAIERSWDCEPPNTDCACRECRQGVRA